MTDVIIIGAGPAGMTAAIYAIRAGLSVIIFESAMYGGQIVNTPDVENYPSIQKITGWELAQNIYNQIVAMKADIRFELVKGIEVNGDIKTVIAGENKYEAKTVIIANGAKRRKLDCPGEEAFIGRGVSYCATCDGNFYKNKNVAVVGGGNTALEDALYLSNLCSKVYLIHKKGTFHGKKELVDAIQSRENIEILYSYIPIKVIGDKAVNSLMIKKADTNEELTLDVNAIFVATIPVPENVVFSNILSLNKTGHIIAGEDCTTNVAGIYAAGDTRTKLLRQIVTAASDGAIAATQAANYINSNKVNI